MSWGGEVVCLAKIGSLFTKHLVAKTQNKAVRHRLLPGYCISSESGAHHSKLDLPDLPGFTKFWEPRKEVLTIIIPKLSLVVIGTF